VNFLDKLQVLLPELLLKDLGNFIKENSDIEEAVDQLNLTIIELS